MTPPLGFALIAALAAMPLAAHDCCGHDGYHHRWQDGQQQGQHCWREWTEAAPVDTLQGTVAEINAISDSPVVEIWLKAGKDTTLVRLAPEPFLKQNGFSLKPGDSLSVKGYRTRSGSDLFVASEIESAGKILVLRGERGRPAW